jgi:uncharacterized RDD family membrane protein YckC
LHLTGPPFFVWRDTTPLQAARQVNAVVWQLDLESIMNSPQPSDTAIREPDPAVDAGPAKPRHEGRATGIQGNEPMPRGPGVPPEDAEQHLPEIVIIPGDASKDRFIAAWMDSAGATVLALVSAGAVPSTEVVLRGIALVAAYLGYFFVSEAAIGTSPGKLAFGLWVRRLEGGPCSIWQAAVRTLARLVEVNPLLLGAIPACVAILASANRQRIGDMMAGTVVRRGRSA